MAEMLEFSPVTLKDHSSLDPFLKEYGSASCQHSFPAMLGLKAKYGDEFCFVDDVLFIHRSLLDHDGFRVYLAPLGNISRDFDRNISILLDDAHCHHARVSFETVTGEFKDMLSSAMPDTFEADYVRDMSEYLYSVSDFSRLSGKALAAKRNRVGAFFSAYSGRVRIEDINSSNIGDVHEFTLRWFEEKMVSDHDLGLESEFKAIPVYLDNFDLLGFKGVSVYLDNSLVGYAAGFPLSSDTMDEVIEKGRRDITGIYQLLCHEFATRCSRDFLFVNREEDLGVEGLRRSKLSYGPVRLLDKYIVREK